jgi:hypothetical protein
MKEEKTTLELNFTTQIIKQVIDSWTSRNTAVTNFFKAHDDEVYFKDIAPGRNRSIYLLGHLIATNDTLLPLFGLGEKLFPELETYSNKPDKSFEDIATLTELKKKWETINKTLTDHFNTMTPTDWLSRHTAVSEEDFAKEPQRNKLNVLIGRTNHQSYHVGQLNLLTVKELVS